jgi:hypothetical protein
MSILPICWCFQLLKFVGIWGQQTIDHDQSQTSNECPIHKNLTNFLSCNILCVYV